MLLLKIEVGVEEKRQQQQQHKNKKQTENLTIAENSWNLEKEMDFRQKQNLVSDRHHQRKAFLWLINS